MNIQQFTNPQFWTQFVPESGGVLLSISLIAALGGLVVVFLDQGQCRPDHDFAPWSYLFLVQFLATS